VPSQMRSRRATPSRRIAARLGLLVFILLLSPLAQPARGAAGTASPSSGPPAGHAFTILRTTATPDSVRQWIVSAEDSTEWKDADQVTVFDRTEVRVEQTGMGHVFHHTLTKVLTENGARDLATLRFDYDPASSFIRLDGVSVHGADGKTRTLDLARAVDLPAPADMIYWGARMKLLALPRLSVGDAIEVWTYKKGFQIAYLDDTAPPPPDDERYIPPMRGHFYDVVTFQDTHPMKEKTYLLRTPRNKPVQYAVYNGSLASSMRFADSLLVYQWQAKDVPAFKEESRIPELTDLVPKVVLATVENWPEKSRWFFQVNDSVFAADDRIRAKVNDLVKGLRSDDEKMAVLLHWVAQEIRYSGLSMGKGEGYTLHPGVMTFQDRCGVCKDIAGMLVTMLRAAGYAANPVMTMAGARVEAIPADQFNHCVVAVKRPDGTYTMLDPTWAPFDRSVWSRFEGEQNIVIGSTTGEGLSAIRTFTPDESRLTISGQSRLDAEGTLIGTLLIEGVGASDSRLRGTYSDSPARDRKLATRELLAGLGPALEISDLKFTDPRDFSQNARIEATYRVPRYAEVADSILAFTPPLLKAASKSGRLCRLLSFTKGTDERKYDALLWNTQELVVQDRISLPSGFHMEGGIDTVGVKQDAGSVRGSCRATGAELNTELTAVSAKRTVPAKNWAGGVEAADSLRSFGDRLRWARRGK
jgi:hypothetical protein